MDRGRNVIYVGRGRRGAGPLVVEARCFAGHRWAAKGCAMRRARGTYGGTGAERRAGVGRRPPHARPRPAQRREQAAQARGPCPSTWAALLPPGGESRGALFALALLASAAPGRGTRARFLRRAGDEKCAGAWRPPRHRGSGRAAGQARRSLRGRGRTLLAGCMPRSEERMHTKGQGLSGLVERARERKGHVVGADEVHHTE